MASGTLAVLLLGSGAASAQTVAVPPLGGGSGAAGGGVGQQQQENGQRRTVEAQGAGPTEAEARASAVRAALEQVVGVYLVSSRRSELRVQGSQVHDAFEERVVAHSNGFVERVTTLGTWRDAGEINVLIRADVVINRLMEAMREARRPLIPIDQNSMQATLRTQVDRDQSARQLIAEYLADLPKNVDVQLGRMQTAVLSTDPNFATITAPVTFRVKPDYIARGHALMREAPEDIETGRAPGRNTVLAVCAPRFETARVQFGTQGALSCRGVGASRESFAAMRIENRDAFLLGDGKWRLAPQNVMSLFPGADTGGGVFLGLQVIDGSGGVVAAGSTRLRISCTQPVFQGQIVHMSDWERLYFERERRQGKEVFRERLRQRRTRCRPAGAERWAPARHLQLLLRRVPGPVRRQPAGSRRTAPFPRRRATRRY
jgi:hypothetical protein